MQITVFGASGKVGRLVVAELIAADHGVVVFVHKANPFVGLDQVKVIAGSVDDQAAVTAAVAGSQIIISTLGSWGTSNKTIVSTGTAAIIEAAVQNGVRRVITLTGASAWAIQDNPLILDKATHALLRLLAPKILNDGEKHLQLLEASSLNWTSVRSPAMLSFGKTSYKFSLKLPSLLATVPRQAVVAAIIDQLTDKKHYQQAPVVRRG